MLAFDASSIIYAWDNYPIGQFPGMWDWIEQEVTAQRILMSSVAFDEVSDKTPDCAQWLQSRDLEKLPVGPNQLAEAMRIKGLLGIPGDKYHPKGVGENDIIIVGTCRLLGLPLVSDEERQPNLPVVVSKMKIPAVCKLPLVNVDCINFLDYIKRSGRVFR